MYGPSAGLSLRPWPRWSRATARCRSASQRAVEAQCEARPIRPWSSKTPGARSVSARRLGRVGELPGSEAYTAGSRHIDAPHHVSWHPLLVLRSTVGPLLDSAWSRPARLSNLVFENSRSLAATPLVRVTTLQGLTGTCRGEIFSGRRAARGRRSAGIDPGSSGLRVDTGEDRPRRREAPGPSVFRAAVDRLHGDAPGHGRRCRRWYAQEWFEQHRPPRSALPGTTRVRGSSCLRAQPRHADPATGPLPFPPGSRPSADTLRRSLQPARDLQRAPGGKGD